MSLFLNPTYIFCQHYFDSTPYYFFFFKRKNSLQVLSRMWKLPWSQTEPAVPWNSPEFTERLWVSLKLTVTLGERRAWVQAQHFCKAGGWFTHSSCSHTQPPHTHTGTHNSCTHSLHTFTHLHSSHTPFAHSSLTFGCSCIQRSFTYNHMPLH